MLTALLVAVTKCYSHKYHAGYTHRPHSDPSCVSTYSQCTVRSLQATSRLLLHSSTTAADNSWEQCDTNTSFNVQLWM